MIQYSKPCQKNKYIFTSEHENTYYLIFHIKNLFVCCYPKIRRNNTHILHTGKEMWIEKINIYFRRFFQRKMEVLTLEFLKLKNLKGNKLMVACVCRYFTHCFCFIIGSQCISCVLVRDVYVHQVFEAFPVLKLKKRKDTFRRLSHTRWGDSGVCQCPTHHLIKYLCFLVHDSFL